MQPQLLVTYNPSDSKVHDKTDFTRAPSARTDRGTGWAWAWALSIPKSSKRLMLPLFLAWSTSKDYVNLVGERKGWTVAPGNTQVNLQRQLLQGCSVRTNRVELDHGHGPNQVHIAACTLHRCTVRSHS